MKKLLALFICLFSVTFVFAEKCSEEIKQQLIDVYTKYAEGTTVDTRAKYCLNPDLEKMEKYYSGKTFGYTPKKFGTCEYYPDRDLYLLTELVEGRNAIRVVEIPRYGFFKKEKGEFKLDWDAIVAYNPITLKKYNVSKSEDEIEFRCFISMTENYYSNMNDYYAFTVRDESTNYIFNAYGAKKGAGGELFDLFDGNETRPLIVKIKYNAYVDKYIITEFVQKQWSKLKK